MYVYRRLNTIANLSLSKMFQTVLLRIQWRLNLLNQKTEQSFFNTIILLYSNTFFQFNAESAVANFECVWKITEKKQK